MSTSPLPQPTLVCPILSIRNAEYTELCITDRCALYMPQTHKCALLVMGFQAMMDVQRMQAGQKSTTPAPGSSA